MKVSNVFYNLKILIFILFNNKMFITNIFAIMQMPYITSFGGGL